jgi:hypothetical protein
MDPLGIGYSLRVKTSYGRLHHSPQLLWSKLRVLFRFLDSLGTINIAAGTVAKCIEVIRRDTTYD